ncbi:MAG: hypothetical protein IMW98_08680 [Firmicutes bacterium]|nr:hypothetical protein [Bacillota bacterium]MBE3590881.1 hypothetical protein [Bacillota bacterium]
MTCPECGAMNGPAAERCAHCGAALAPWRGEAFLTARRAGAYRVRPLLALLLGVLLILPLALAALVEMESGLRLAPVPLVLAVLLAVAGFEVLLRAAGRDPQAAARRRLARGRRRHGSWA